jgi:hypothetical protein
VVALGQCTQPNVGSEVASHNLDEEIRLNCPEERVLPLMRAVAFGTDSMPDAVAGLVALRRHDSQTKAAKVLAALDAMVTAGEPLVVTGVARRSRVSRSCAAPDPAGPPGRFTSRSRPHR